MNILQKLYTYINSFHYDSIPAAHIKMAKELFEDGIACMIAGSRQQKIRDYAVYARDVADVQKALIVGLNGYRVSTEKAAMANAMSAHIRDFDDICISISAHCTASELGVIFAIAQQQIVTGKEALEAYITGLEAASVMGRGFYGKDYEAALDSTSTIGIYGAVTAAGKLYKLNEEQWLNALSLAASEGLGFRANYGTDAKDLTMGRVAEKAIYIAEMARRGFSASHDVMEDTLGYLKGFRCAFDEDSFCRSIDERISEFDTPGLIRKYYPTCGSMHTGIDAALELVRRYHPSVDEIDHIVCYAHPNIIEGNLYDVPEDPVQGKFSLPYCVALSLVHGAVGLHPFEGEKVTEYEALELMKRLSVTPAHQFSDVEDKGVHLTVTMKNGSVYETEVTEQTGSPARPLTEEQREYKFKECTKDSMNAKTADQIRQWISQFEDIQNVGGFVEDLDAAIVC